jgi:17beta-estradiol 17-dehydrogenase / very-long-chain 3-oxoacyl-CoA reductase
MAGISRLWIHMLTSVGAFTLLFNTYFIIRFLTFHLIKPLHPLQSYKRASPDPAYALITGSSAGIGFGVAQALVKEGLAVILLGHLPDELAEAKATLQRLRPDAVVRILVMDAKSATPREMDAAVQSIADLQVSILVNNVGGYPVKLPTYRALATYSSEDVDASINMNARFMARITALMLPILSRRPSPKDRSLILNVSSGGMVGVPWAVMYGATKAFNWSFSCGLARELEASPETNHIDCLAIIPGEVRTQLNSDVPDSEPSWDHFGQCVVDKVDNALSRGQRDMRPFMMHDIKIRIGAVLPEGMKTAALTAVMRKKRDSFIMAYEKSRESMVRPVGTAQDGRR